MNINRKRMKIFGAKFDRVNALIAGAVLLFVFTVYYLTKAPTLSFWDCGEFIAVSWILGIPHPPGTPLFVLLGRIFAILPLDSDPAVRINLLSVVSSSFTALFGYLIVVRLLRLCFGQTDDKLTRFIIYAGGAAGALFLAFGLTNWNNSVEAEVYGLSMMLMACIFWLALVYHASESEVVSEKVMLLAVFLAFAGIGVHMTTFLVVPAVALFFVIPRKADNKSWYALAVFFLLEMYLIFAMSSRPGEVPYYIPIAIVFVFYLFFVFSYDRIPAVYLALGAGFLIAIFPLFGYLYSSATELLTPGTLGKSPEWIGTVGRVGYGLLLMSGILLFILYLRSSRKGDIKKHYLLAALFVFAGALMTLVVWLNRSAGAMGYHSFLFVTAGSALVLLVVLARQIRWAYLLATVSVSMIIMGLEEFAVGALVGIIVVAGAGLWFKLPGWKNALMIILVAVLGYSIHLYIPIRSAQHPYINENNPYEGLDATVNYIERKQYGSTPMVTRMFTRRGEWVNQFGDFQRMGFWRFFNEQYGLTGPRFMLLFIIGIYGVWELVRKKSRVGIPYMILLFLSSIGLVLYMNFADGTRDNPSYALDYLEVRDRDYFFTPAFIFFGLAIGLGTAFVIQFLREAASSFAPTLRKVIVGISLLLFLLPGFALANNYYFADRSKNYIPFDYAWNILVSCDENAVLFTAGDNDTFPIWCLQEAYGIRKDVSLVNFSLANTHWYIKQIRDYMGIELGWNDNQITNIRSYRDNFGAVHRVADQVVSEIISRNFGKRPLNFAVTVPDDVRSVNGRSIDSLLILQGMVWRMTKEGIGFRRDIEKSIELLTSPDKFKFRSIADPDIYKDDATLRLTRNSALSFMLVADSLKKVGDYDQVDRLIKKALADLPHATDAVNFAAAFYSQQGNEKDLKELIATTKYGEIRWLKTLLGRLYARHDQPDKAEQVYKEILAEHPIYKPPLDDLMRLYFDQREPEKLKSLMETWLEHNPNDRQIRQLLNSVDREFKRIEEAGDSL